MVRETRKSDKNVFLTFLSLFPSLDHGLEASSFHPGSKHFLPFFTLSRDESKNAFQVSSGRGSYGEWSTRP